MSRERDAELASATTDPTDRVLTDEERAHPSRQRLRHDRRRRLAARFHRNALYYNIADFSLWDYVGGMEDMLARRLRLIGDPETALSRGSGAHAARGALRGEAGIHARCATARAGIAHLRELLARRAGGAALRRDTEAVPHGSRRRSLQVLRRRGLLDVLLPNVEKFLVRHPGSLVEKLLVAGLENTDERVSAGKSVTPTFLFALLLYGPIAAYIEKQPQEQWGDVGTILDGCDHALREALQRVMIPRRFSLGVRDMFALQPQLENPRSRRVLRLIEQPRFRAAYDLLLLRAKVGMAPREVADWWTALQAASPQQRQDMAMALEAARGRSGRSEGGGEGDEGGAGPDRPRRRRRRRRPAGPE
jgi:poly(A) polymerase